MKPKFVFAALILLALLFIVVLASGGTQNSSGDQPPKDPKSTQNNSDQQQQDLKKWAATYPPPGWARGIGRLIAPLSPKLKLVQTSFVFGASAVTVGVPASLTESFRSAAFQITKGCSPDQRPSDCSNVSIVYFDPVQEGPPGLNNQTWQGQSGKPDQGSLLILKGGGTLTFSCKTVPACAAELQ